MVQSGAKPDRGVWSEYFREGLMECLSAPGWGVFAAMTGFGALAGDGGASIAMALALTAGLWSMPGQVAFVELSLTGISALALFLAVTLANVRMLPLTIGTIPLLRTEPRRRPVHFLWAQLNSVTSYVQLVDVVDRIEDRRMRSAHFVGFTLGTYILGMTGTALGFLMAGRLPVFAVQAMVFITPLYLLMLVARNRQRMVQMAVVAGCVLVPSAHLVSKDWGLLVGGLAAGTLAFGVSRLWGRSDD